MNYIKELNAFYDWLETNPLSTSAIALWHALMHINNKAGWTEEFGVAVSVLCIKTGLADRTIRDARNELKQKGRIDWNSRKGNQSAIYKIIPLVNTLSAISADSSADNHADKYADSNADNHATLNKLNKTKLNIKRKKEISKTEDDKNKYAEFVYMSEDEYTKLIEKHGEILTKRMIEALDNYKGSIGKTYKSDYRAILSWVESKILKENNHTSVPKDLNNSNDLNWRGSDKRL